VAMPVPVARFLIIMKRATASGVFASIYIKRADYLRLAEERERKKIEEKERKKREGKKEKKKEERDWKKEEERGR
jgi:hypothetical protein